MPNFAGQRAYTLLQDATVMVDAGDITKNVMGGIARGGLAQDYNVKIRGLSDRIDRRPERPYP